MTKYYVYRWQEPNCNSVEFLGTFETSFELPKVWDLIAQVFCEGKRGFFTRTRRIYE